MEEQRYPILYIEELKVAVDDLIADWIFNHPKTNQIIIVTDSVVFKCQQRDLQRMQLKITALEAASVVATTYVIPEGEASKSIQEAERLWNYMADKNFGRNDLLIAFGGGVVGDLTGFCASTYLRGVAFIQIPTTLLAQIDSSVGGKVAINLSQGKNLVGQFYNPEMVIINTNYLLTLPDEIFVDGLGELIKYGYLGDAIILQWLSNHANILGIRQELIDNPLAFEMIVKRCILIKEAIVDVDFKENGIRKYLNFGHTLGHAIEQWSAYEMRHGHCVVMGIWIVLQMAIQSAGSPSEYMVLTKKFEQLEALMDQFEMPLVKNIPVAKLMPYLRNDKKSESNGIQFIWPRERDVPIQKKLTDERTQAVGDERTQAVGDERTQAVADERAQAVIDENSFDSTVLDQIQIIKMVESNLKIKWIDMADLETILKSLFAEGEAKSIAGWVTK